MTTNLLARMTLVTTITILLSAAPGASAAAQERATNANEQNQSREAARESLKQPQPDGALIMPQPQFTLLAEKGKQAVSGTLGIALDDWNLDVTFSGPIGETDREASPLTLGGLQNGASIRFGFSQGNIGRRWLSSRDVDRISEFCDEQQLGDDCDTTDMTPDQRAQFIRLLLPRVSVLWGVHVTLNREKFTFSTDDGLTDTSLSHTNQGFTGSIGLLTSDLWFLAAHVERQKFRKAAGPAQQVCIPSGTQGAIKCRTTRLGAPSDTLDTSLLTLEGRRIFVRSNVGVNPRFTADLEEDVQTFEVPVYFMREQGDPSKNPVPGLNGGVSVGWHSKNGAVVRAFVGVAFKLIGLR
jgi:hypothetical protein